MAYLQIEHLHVRYRQGDRFVSAVRDCCLTVERGDSLGIVGESGSGKSTLAMALLRTLPGKTAEVTGRILLDGRDILALPERGFSAVRWVDMAMVFQKSMSAFSPVHRIGHQLENVYRVHYPGVSWGEIRRELLELFAVCGLEEGAYTRYPFELSGGMLQRVSIVMALMHRPGLLILDEATTALDVLTQQQIMAELKSIQKTYQFTLMVISHDLSVISKLCEKTAVMYCGSVLETGPTRQVLAEPFHPYTRALAAAYPRLGGEWGSLQGIPGTMPDMSAPAAGCVFADRCSCCQARCREAVPELCQVAEQRWSACPVGVEMR